MRQDRLSAIRWTILLLVAALAASPARARGGEITGIVSFGDSLSDVGNFYAATNGAAPPTALGYAPGNYTDGWNWVQYLSQDLGVQVPTASLNGGTDYAYGSAQSGMGTTLGSFYDAKMNLVTATVPNVWQQVTDYLAKNSPGQGQLFTIWGGANDLLHGTNPDAALAITAASNIAQAADQLATAGAHQILVLNLPLLGNLPYIVANESAAAQQGLNQLSMLFNQSLANDLATLPASTQADIHLIDIASLVNDAEKDPSKYGFTNVTGTGIQALAMGQSPDGYLSWDGIHPTTQADRFVAMLAAEAVPEPSSLVLFASAIAVVAAWHRKARAGQTGTNPGDRS